MDCRPFIVVTAVAVIPASFESSICGAGSFRCNIHYFALDAERELDTFAFAQETVYPCSGVPVQAKSDLFVCKHGRSVFFICLYRFLEIYNGLIQSLRQQARTVETVRAASFIVAWHDKMIVAVTMMSTRGQADVVDVTM